MRLRKVRFFFFIVLSLVVSLVACTPDSTVRHNIDNKEGAEKPGTGDGGGGIVEGSTKEEVRAAIFAVRETLRNPGLLSALIGDHPERLQRDKVDPLDRRLSIKDRKAIVKIVSLGKDDSIEDFFNKQNKLDDFIGGIELDIKERGSCSAPDKEHPDASVKEFSLDSSVCFSVENLQRIPRAVLHLSIAGLWFHELAHIFGYDEKIAVRLQEIVEYTYSALVPSYHSESSQFFRRAKTSLQHRLYMFNFVLFNESSDTIPVKDRIDQRKSYISSTYGLFQGLAYDLNSTLRNTPGVNICRDGEILNRDEVADRFLYLADSIKYIEVKGLNKELSVNDFSYSMKHHNDSLKYFEAGVCEQPSIVCGKNDYNQYVFHRVVEKIKYHLSFSALELLLSKNMGEGESSDKLYSLEYLSDSLVRINLSYLSIMQVFKELEKSEKNCPSFSQDPELNKIADTFKKFKKVFYERLLAKEFYNRFPSKLLDAEVKSVLDSLSYASYRNESKKTNQSIDWGEAIISDEELRDYKRNIEIMISQCDNIRYKFFSHDTTDHPY